MSPAQKAQVLAADLRHVLRAHKARVDWVLAVDGRCVVTVVIDAPEAGGIGRLLRSWWRRIFG